MRARVSIPAWAKRSVVAAGALLISCGGGDLACPRLQEELRHAQRDGGMRSSALWVHQGTAGDDVVVRISKEREGDFPYHHSTLSTRECLGADWSESQDSSIASGWSAPAARFQRPGWPDVVVYEQREGSVVGAEGEAFSQRVQLVIEGQSQ